MPQSPLIVTRTRDLLGYAGSPPDPRWPGGARVAVSIVVNFEEGAEFSINDGDCENEAVYEIEQRFAGRPDPAIDSHFEYGSRAGWWRIMEVLGARGRPRCRYGPDRLAGDQLSLSRRRDAEHGASQEGATPK